MESHPETIPGDGLTMLVAYDASEEARSAMTAAARLLKPRKVLVVTAWEPSGLTAARAASAGGLRQPDWSEPEEGEEDPAYTEALATLKEGVQLADSLGLHSVGHLTESAQSIWSALVDAAEELHPDVIVAGTRGVTGLRALWQSSVADQLLKKSAIPVFIVPPVER